MYILATAGTLLVLAGLEGFNFFLSWMDGRRDNKKADDKTANDA